MVRFLIEMEGRSVELDLLPECEVRSTVHPMAARLSKLLSNVSEPVDVVFCIDDDGFLSMKLQGSIVAVNEARDAIGEQRFMGMRTN